MPFPEENRVVYKNNPLDRVICQLRFPAILKIDTDVPAGFQEKIRELYPLYDVKQVTIQNVFPNSVPGLPQLHLQIGDEKEHKFSTSDGKYEITLTKNFIALTSYSYERWEEFLSHLLHPVQALCEEYKPANFTRVGLRYIDIFKRTAIGFDKEEQWSNLFKSCILGPIADEALAAQVKGMDCTYEIALSENIGIARTNMKLLKELPSEEECLSLDSDFFCKNKYSSEEMIERLNALHDRAFRLMRWCITDKLHKALEPQEI